MQINPLVFREYDIRGIAGTAFNDNQIKEYEKWYGKFPGVTLTPEAAVAIGKAYGTLIARKQGRTIVIGHEVRTFGEELKENFIKGVRTTGINVIDIGTAITPLVYFAIAHYQLDGGVSVTGSHNLYFYNGFKTMGKNVMPIFGAELKEMESIIKTESYANNNIGTITNKDVFPNYKSFILDRSRLQRSIKVVVDSGNGSAGLFLPQILKELSCDVVELYSEADSSFPHHTPDPSDPFNMTELSKSVVDNKADLGIGMDADGDRMGVVDNNGNFVFADLISCILSKDILSRNPGKKVIYDVKSSLVLNDEIAKCQGKPIIFPTGHALIKKALRDDQEIVFASELSGHFYFVENHYKFDDGVYAACQFIKLLSQTNLQVSELIQQLPKTIASPEIKLPCLDEHKQKVAESLSNFFREKYDCILLDGVRIKFSESGWGLVRASNTSPCIAIRFEGKDEDEALGIKNILAQKLSQYPEILDKLDTSQIASHNGKLGWI